MLDIGFPELMLVAVVGLLVIGPERLPETLRTLGLWIGRLSRSFSTVKAEIEKEIGMDEVKRQLHNEAIMEQMKRIEEEVQTSVDDSIDKVKMDSTSLHPLDPDNIPTSVTSPSSNATNDVDAASPEADPSTTEQEPVKRRPPSEAEVEAAYLRKQKAQQQQAANAANQTSAETKSEG
ncbi:MAG: Sec-independent protein translocase protein TatB [Pseudomonadota bacterium]